MENQMNALGKRYKCPYAKLKTSAPRQARARSAAAARKWSSKNLKLYPLPINYM
jgi:hypothetical protein